MATNQSTKQSRVPKGTKVCTWDWHRGGFSIDPSKTTVNVKAVPELYSRDTWFGRNAEKAILALAGKSNVEICWWGSDTGGYKFCLGSDVEVFDPGVPAPRKESTKPRAVPFANQLIAKSEWLAKEEIAIPQYRQITGGKWYEYEYFTNSSVKPGSKLTIVKRVTGIRASAYADEKSAFVNVTVDGNKTQVSLRVSDLKDKIEIEKVVQEYLFTFFDTAKKNYYVGHDYRSTMEFDDKLTKAKKFKRLNDARTSALLLSGYFKNLPGSWGSLPDWMYTETELTIPRTWVIHKYDKLTKELVEEIDLLDSFDHAWRRRALTVQYGSALRKTYSDLDKKEQLDKFPAMIVFKKKTSRYWEEELTEKEKTEIQEAVESLDKKSIKVTRNSNSVAIAITDVSEAMAAKLSYNGEIELVVIDTAKLEEVVS